MIWVVQSLKSVARNTLFKCYWERRSDSSEEKLFKEILKTVYIFLILELHLWYKLLRGKAVLELLSWKLVVLFYFLQIFYIKHKCANFIISLWWCKKGSNVWDVPYLKLWECEIACNDKLCKLHFSSSRVYSWWWANKMLIGAYLV